MSKRIAVIAPRGRDAEVVQGILRSATIDALVTTLDVLLPALAGNHFGAAVLTQEALVGLSPARARESVKLQPAWSDFPFVLLTTPDRDEERAHLATALGNVTQVERPVLPATLLNCVQAALRARLRQHEMRDLLDQQVRAERKISELAHSLEERVRLRTIELEQANASLEREIHDKEEAEAKLRDLQATLIHVSRVSAANTMASTIAHELNQPLAATVNYLRGAERLLRETDVAAPIIAAVSAAASNAHRAGSIIRHLRAMVSNTPVTRTTESMAEMIDNARRLVLLEPATDEYICNVHIGEDADSVFADRVQLEQVLVNLMRNALESMEALPRPRVDIRATRHDDTVLVTVRDFGPGFATIPLDLSSPSFSSSKTNGLGIGLSICRTIVEANGGSLAVDNAPSGGAQVMFTVPRHAKAQAGE
jgi:C4-dicarboxylate-specific signal transduction histidine kinase